jgi:phosphatidylserine decarboxylase precursor
MIRKTWTSLIGAVSVGLVSFGASSTINAQQYTFYPPPYQIQQYPCSSKQVIVNKLYSILNNQNGLMGALEAAINSSKDMTAVDNLHDYFQFVGFMVDWSPDAGDLRNFISQFYYIVDQAPEDQLNKNGAFNVWMNDFAQAWGACLDTPISTQNILTFKFDPRFKYHDYKVPPGDRWRSFNEFFSRRLKQDRPIDKRDNAIVFPADSTYAGFGYVSKNSTITAKGVEWNASDLLAGSRFKSVFDGGKWVHSFLDVYDYHRYHLPVGGTIKEVLRIPGRVYLDVTKELVSEEKEGVTKKKWILDIKDGGKYQYWQQRGAVVIDSPEMGCVAVLPIGMAQVSSVNFTVTPGEQRCKGDEFGYFLFGGSDIIILFQKEMPPFEWEAEVGTHYLQGAKLAKPACKTYPCTPSCPRVFN